MQYISLLRRKEMNRDEEEDEEPYVPRYIGDNTAFMKWSTEVEQIPYVIDKRFLERNRYLVGDINKFLPLSNINTAKAVKLFHLRRNNIALCMEAGLNDVAERTMLANWADYQTTRGIRGFYQNALITQKRMLEEKVKTEQKRWSRLRSIFRQEEDIERNEWIAG